MLHGWLPTPWASEYSRWHRKLTLLLPSGAGFMFSSMIGNFSVFSRLLLSQTSFPRNPVVSLWFYCAFRIDEPWRKLLGSLHTCAAPISQQVTECRFRPPQLQTSLNIYRSHACLKYLGVGFGGHLDGFWGLASSGMWLGVMTCDYQGNIVGLTQKSCM